MKIGMLVGACGLALAGTTFAGVKGVSGSPAMPKMVERSESKLIDEDMMALYRASRLENSRVASPTRSLASSARGIVGPAPIFRDDFDSQDSDNMRPQDGDGIYVYVQNLLSPAGYDGQFDLDGQFNPDGLAWNVVPSWGPGVVDNTIAQSNMDGVIAPGNGEYNGPPGGPDPTGVRGGMAHVQRASVGDAPTAFPFGTFTFQNLTDLYIGSSGQPLFVQLDIYKPTHQEFQWWQPISFAEGLVMTRIFAFGVDDGNQGAFSVFAQRRGDPNLLESMVILGNDPGNPAFGEFVYAAKDIPEGGWYTIGILVDPAGNFMSIFVQDSETLADNDLDGNPDWQMPDNTVTGMKMFEEFGYGLEMGWASVLPGTLDDPSTPTITEGAGYTTNDNDVVTQRFFFNGNDVTAPLAAVSHDASQMLHGSDGAAVIPTYEIRDWWFDDYRVQGIDFPVPDPIPTYRIPYVDDMERWNVGPLGLQSGRWFINPSANVTIDDNENNTLPPGTGMGTPTQAVRTINQAQTDQFFVDLDTNLPTTPRVRAEVGDPMVVQSGFQFETSLISYMISVEEKQVADASFTGANQRPGRLLTSAQDVNAVGDGRTYIRQAKPRGTNVAGGEFDESRAVEPLSGPNLTPDQEEDKNTEFLNIPAAPAGGDPAGFQLNENDWYTVRFEVEPGTGMPAANGDLHNLRVFIDLNNDKMFAPSEEFFPFGNAALSWTCNTLTADEIEYASGHEFIGGFADFFADDIFFGGPTQTDTVVDDMGNLIDPEFADDPAWELPFADGLDTYETDRPAPPQGFANYRVGFLPVQDPALSDTNDFSTIEFIDGAPAIAGGDLVVQYVVASIDQGTPGFNIGDTVSVSLENVDSEYDPEDNIYGSAMNPTDWFILDAVNGSEIARGTWTLASATGVATFNSMTDIDAGIRYSWRKNFRWGGSDTEAFFVSAASEGIDTVRGSRGDVVKMEVSGNSNDNSTPNGGLRNNVIGMFNGLLPVALADTGADTARLGFDFYVGQSQFETGAFATMAGATADGGAITALSFGGKGFQSGNQDPVTGLDPFLPTGNFGYLVENPAPGPGNPDNIWVDTGVAVPTQTWFTVEATVNGNSEWTISVDGTEIASGIAIDVANPEVVTNGFDNIAFTRNQFGDNDGDPTLGEITWSARAFDAPAPISGGVGPYHFYQLNEIFNSMGSTTPAPPGLPLIQPVNPTTGALAMDMMGNVIQRPIAAGDRIAAINVDPDTMTPFDSQLLNTRWVLDDGMGGTIANGNWTVLGLPGIIPPSQQAPAGGISAGNTPPYNNMASFNTILLADYVNVEQLTVFPPDVWYADNITLQLDADLCPEDLDGSGAVGSGDLGIVLAAWGTSDPAADLDGNGVVGSGDLGILLAAWGACPTS